jgi:hypothetical protein
MPFGAAMKCIGKDTIKATVCKSGKRSAGFRTRPK